MHIILFFFLDMNTRGTFSCYWQEYSLFFFFFVCVCMCVCVFLLCFEKLVG